MEKEPQNTESNKNHRTQYILAIIAGIFGIIGAIISRSGESPVAAPPPVVAVPVNVTVNTPPAVSTQQPPPVSRPTATQTNAQRSEDAVVTLSTPNATSEPGEATSAQTPKPIESLPVAIKIVADMTYSNDQFYINEELIDLEAPNKEYYVPSGSIVVIKKNDKPIIHKKMEKNGSINIASFQH